MKRIISILIMCAMLTGCGNSYEYENAEIPTVSPTEITSETADKTESAEEKSENIGEISYEVTTTCSDMISPITTTSEIADISPKNTESQTTVTVSENAEEKCSDDSEETAESAQVIAEIPETQPKTESQTAVTVSENIKEKEPVDSVTTAVQTETSVTEIPDIPQKTDYEKAWEIYSYMRENGSGTCVNYACQTYEMCQNVGLPCYIVWTNAGMYGHVANTVCVNGTWFILDTQGGYFLEYNYSFTEVVDINENHIADGSLISSYSYEELYG